eukprot:gene7868-5495_t
MKNMTAFTVQITIHTRSNREMKFVILPVNKAVNLLPKVRSLDGILESVSSWSGISSDKVLLYWKDECKNRLFPITKLEHSLQEVVYVLFRLTGGGKGGFRKALEKKGREFARAKQKEKKGKKLLPSTGERSEVESDTKKKKIPLPNKRTPVKRVKISTNSRDLAQQGTTLPSNHKAFLKLLMNSPVDSSFNPCSFMSGVSRWKTVKPTHVERDTQRLKQPTGLQIITQSDPARFIIPEESDLLFQDGLSEIVLMDLFSKQKRKVKTMEVCPLCHESGPNLSSCGCCGQLFHWKCVELHATMRKCSSCNEFLMDAQYRCLLCVTNKVVLCKKCYRGGRAHPSHPFASEKDNRVAIPARQPEAERGVLQNLQYREINPDDYETLLLLDDGSSTTPLRMEVFLQLPTRACDESENKAMSFNSPLPLSRVTTNKQSKNNNNKTTTPKRRRQQKTVGNKMSNPLVKVNKYGRLHVTLSKVNISLSLPFLVFVFEGRVHPQKMLRMKVNNLVGASGVGKRFVSGVAPVLYFPIAPAQPVSEEEQIKRNTDIAIEMIRRFKGPTPAPYTRKSSATIEDLEKEIQSLLGAAEKLRKTTSDDQPMDKLGLMERCLRHSMYSYYKDQGSLDFEGMAKWLVYTPEDELQMTQLKRRVESKAKLAAFREKRKEQGLPSPLLPSCNWKNEYQAVLDRELVNEKRLRYDTIAQKSVERDEAKVDAVLEEYRKPLQDKRLDDLVELLERFKPVLAREAILQRLTIKHLEGQLGIWRYMDWCPEVRDRAELEVDVNGWQWWSPSEERRLLPVRLRTVNEVREIMAKSQAEKASQRTESAAASSGSSSDSERDRLLKEVLALQARIHQREEAPEAKKAH